MPPTVLSSLNEALHRLLGEVPEALVLGEDIGDPYGGAFKVTRGLSSAYPDRVLTTPISEAGFVGLATGMALRGFRPVAEIMFGDFLLLAADQLVNHACKYPWMYGGACAVPLVIRAPMGGYRGYGPTHSQCLESHLLPAPGLNVVAVSALGVPGELLSRAAREETRPTLLVEHKLLYPRRLRAIAGGRCGDFFVREARARWPGWLLSPNPFRSADVTVACYGYQSEQALDMAVELFVQSELAVEVAVVSDLARPPLELLADSVSRTGRLIALDEAPQGLNFSALLGARVLEAGLPVRQFRRLCARPVPLPASPQLEREALPGPRHLRRAIEDLCAQAAGVGEGEVLCAP